MTSIDADMTAAELLDVADGLLGTIVPGTRGLWPRTVAFVVRFALEQGIDEFWASTLPGMRECSMRAQLVCLREYGEPSLAGRAHAVWGSLSAACHYNQYDLAPTAAELRRWHADVSDIGASLTRLGLASVGK
jgi:hypothetical protein